ncbi:hypothetical protein RQM59_10945 [Flavobacteriaceae bacterium S356]|uniref:Uncharacterized protein n=1 Tax=Asprobacillus argus TaxID=3076534 RepID=A0ABU3LI60_9FLAO|nr:hypothetical protein [Flavobacteriaceae bacterium S356]
MELLILKTDISSNEKIKRLLPIFNSHPIIRRWSVDTEDIDNVLRIEVAEKRNDMEIIKIVKDQGFYCESLPDY